MLVVAAAALGAVARRVLLGREPLELRRAHRVEPAARVVCLERALVRAHRAGGRRAHAAHERGRVALAQRARARLLGEPLEDARVAEEVLAAIERAEAAVGCVRVVERLREGGVGADGALLLEQLRVERHALEGGRAHRRRDERRRPPAAERRRRARRMRVRRATCRRAVAGPPEKIRVHRRRRHGRLRKRRRHGRLWERRHRTVVLPRGPEKGRVHRRRHHRRLLARRMRLRRMRLRHRALADVRLVGGLMERSLALLHILCSTRWHRRRLQLDRRALLARWQHLGTCMQLQAGGVALLLLWRRWVRCSGPARLRTSEALLREVVRGGGVVWLVCRRALRRLQRRLLPPMLRLLRLLLLDWEWRRRLSLLLLLLLPLLSARARRLEVGRHAPLLFLGEHGFSGPLNSSSGPWRATARRDHHGRGGRGVLVTEEESLLFLPRRCSPSANLLERAGGSKSTACPP